MLQKLKPYVYYRFVLTNEIGIVTVSSSSNIFNILYIKKLFLHFTFYITFTLSVTVNFKTTYELFRIEPNIFAPVISGLTISVKLLKI